MRPLLGVFAVSLTAPLLAVPLIGASDAIANTGAMPKPDGPRGDWQISVVDSSQSFRGLDAVNRKVAWLGGEDGVPDVDGPGSVWRTEDGGRTWQDVSPPVGADNLLYRDVETTGKDTASVLAIGPGEASRIYRTTDAGETWTETFRNGEPTAFYNCMDFYRGDKRGLAVSDPVDGKFRIIATDDRGRSWRVLPDDGMPPAVDGEFNFAASGTCLTIVGQHAYMGSGGAASRIFHSRDRGLTWDVTDAPIPASPAGGVFSLAFDDPRHGVAVGGDFEDEDDGEDASGYTEDGRTWVPGGDLGGYRSGADWVDDARRTVVAVGPNGSDVTRDSGRTWTTFSDTGFHSVVCVPKRCWASGSGGRVGVLATR